MSLAGSKWRRCLCLIYGLMERESLRGRAMLASETRVKEEVENLRSILRARSEEGTSIPLESVIKAKKLIEVARRWHRVVALGRRRISFAEQVACPESDAKCSASVAENGHFIVYKAEGSRFMVPLAQI